MVGRDSCREDMDLLALSVSVTVKQELTISFRYRTGGRPAPKSIATQAQGWGGIWFGWRRSTLAARSAHTIDGSQKCPCASATTSARTTSLSAVDKFLQTRRPGGGGGSLLVRVNSGVLTRGVTDNRVEVFKD